MSEAYFAFVHTLIRRPTGPGFLAGAAIAGGATIRRLPSTPHTERDGFALDTADATSPRVTYRGAAWQAGRHLGFAVTQPGGAPLLLSETEPAPDAQVAVAAITDAYLGYLSGTPIDTPDGAQAIETLPPGARICLADGTSEPVRGVARIAVSPLFADPLRALPIRIRAGALGGGLPWADIIVSPDLALLLDACLIQASALVNGRTIQREATWPEAYWRIRLSRHGLARVHGVALETIRALLDETEDDTDLPETTAPDYPRATSHRQVPYQIRARLG